MTFSMLPLGAMQAGVIAELNSSAITVGIGGLAVVIFTAGMAITNKEIRDL